MRQPKDHAEMIHLSRESDSRSRNFPFTTLYIVFYYFQFSSTKKYIGILEKYSLELVSQTPCISIQELTGHFLEIKSLIINLVF